jgi:hypothetical protein
VKNFTVEGRPDKNPFIAEMVALYSENQARIEDAIRPLREPRDFLDIPVDNTFRTDTKESGLDRHKDPL